MTKDEIEKKILELNEEKKQLFDNFEQYIMSAHSFNEINMTRWIRDIIYLKSQLNAYLDIYATL